MKLLIHQLKLELSRSRWILLLWAAVLAWMWYWLAASWDSPEKASSFLSRMAPEVLNGIVLSAVIAITLWVHVWDLFRDPRAMWQTRPMPSWILFGAKSAMVFLTVILPVLMMIIHVFPAISGWIFTFYLAAEVMVWCTALHVFVSFLNLQFRWQVSQMIATFAYLIPFYIVVFGGTLPHLEDIYWWFCYILILLAVVLFLISLALFKKNTFLSAKLFIPLGLALSGLHFVPMTLPWYMDKIEGETVKFQETRASKVSLHHASRGSLHYESYSYALPSYSYALPNLKLSGGLSPQYVISVSKDLELSVDGMTVDMKDLWLDLGIYRTGMNLGEEARSVFPSYTGLNQYLDSKGNTTFRLGLNLPISGDKPNQRVELSKTRARATGAALVATSQMKLAFKCPIKDNHIQTTQGKFFSWRNTGRYAFFESKIVDLDLMSSTIPNSVNDRNSNDLTLLLVNNKRKEWFMCNGESLSRRVRTGFLYQLVKIDFQSIQHKWKNNHHSGSANASEQPNWEEWSQDAELVAIERQAGPKVNVELDLELVLPLKIANKIKQK